MKDYAKQGVYMYIIHDIIDNNRFLYFSSRHYEEHTKILPDSFRLEPIPSGAESIHLRIKKSRFGIKFFRIMREKGDFSIIFNEIIYGKGKENQLFKKYKTHNKKIALDNPDWYLEHILSKNIQSHKKKVLRLLLCDNKYNEQIVKHTISTLFLLYNSDYQKFNCHSIVLDEGKTGKSSLIGYFGEKVDNISVAGLYGSSDSLRGKFKGGLVTTTKKAILIDEVNELAKNNKGDKILSVLNSILENGSYNYQKQFGQKITSASQFFFLGNLADGFNFPVFLLGTFGNVETLGRRIGIITYNNNLGGFEQGNIRSQNINPYLEAVSIFCSNLYNDILCNPKFIQKLYKHKYYRHLSQLYKAKVMEMTTTMECDITRQFFRSHSVSIDRIIGRALKLWIFENLDKFIRNEKQYDNHSLYEILCEAKNQIDVNLINLENIRQHIKDFNISDKKEEFNQLEFDNLKKSEQQMIKTFYENRNIIDVKGTPYNSLKDRSDIRMTIKNFKKLGISQKILSLLQSYGLTLSSDNNEIYFKIINKKIFENKTKGLFKEPQKVTPKDDIAKVWEKKSNDIDMADLN